MNPLVWLKLFSPSTWMILAAGAGAVFAGHLVDVHRHETKARAAGRVEVQAKWDAVERVRAAAALKVEVEARAEEQRRAAAQLEITNEAERIAVRDRASRAGLDAAAPGLRHDVAAAIAARGAAACNPCAVDGGSPAVDAGDLLSLVLGEAEDRLRELAIEADRRGAAGNACAASYDALTAKP